MHTGPRFPGHPTDRNPSLTQIRSPQTQEISTQRWEPTRNAPTVNAAIAVVFTGGTLSMKLDPQRGGAVPALAGEEILAQIDRLPPSLTLVQAWRITLPGVGETAPANATPGIVFTGPSNPTLSAPARVDLTTSAYDQDGKGSLAER